MTNAHLEQLRDSVLVERLRDGDRDAGLVLWRRHAPGARTALRSVVEEPEQAEMILRHGFARVVSEIRNNDDPLAPFALHLRTSVLLDAAVGKAEDQSVSPVVLAFSKLNRMDQTLLWASLVETTPITEIARRAWSTASEAENLIRRAETRLLNTWLETLLDLPPASATCHWVIHRAHLGHTGVLVRSAQRRFDRHLEQCSTCREVIDDYDRFPANLLHALIT